MVKALETIKVVQMDLEKKKNLIRENTKVTIG